MKRLASTTLAFLFCCLVTFAASNGGAGKGIKWILDKGVLTISGSGAMKNFGKDRPWIPSTIDKSSGKELSLKTLSSESFQSWLAKSRALDPTFQVVSIPLTISSSFE